MSPRRRRSRLTAAGITVGVVAATIVGSTGGTAAAAAKPKAQSVGRFLDGSLGGTPLQALADLKDARATAPGSTSAQNPLDATVAGQLEVPLGNALQLPGAGVFQLGAANQLAVAQTDGLSYGASGAVRNSGGASLGGSTSYPADAKVDLTSAAAGAALGTLPVPTTLPAALGGTGTGSTADLASLGGVTATIGAVAGLANTKTGGKFDTPQYEISDLTLAIGSPALGSLLSTLSSGASAVSSQITALSSALAVLPLPVTLPTGCAITSPPSSIPLGSGVTIDVTDATITVDLSELLDALGADINDLPPNTDLLAYVLNNLSGILSTGLATVVDGLTSELSGLAATCTPSGVLGNTLTGLIGQLTAGQTALQTLITNSATTLSTSTSSGLGTLTAGLTQLISIGANVQQGAFPLKSEDAPTYEYTSPLAATPDQNTAVVDGQGVVRALEIDVANGQASLALGNAAAGPSTAAVTPTPTTSAPTTTPGTDIPTGVPAGAAGHGGGNSPALPIVLVLIGLVLAGGGVTAYRSRGRFSR